MPKEFSRTQRVAAQVQRELAQLIQFEVKDPRVGMVTISAVDVSRDLSYAKIYVTVLSVDNDVEKALEGLNKAAGFLRRELGKRLSIRVTPQLTFLYDASIENGANLSALIDKAIATAGNKE